MNQLPTKDQIRQWIAENPAQGTKRDIAKAFNIKGAGRIELKRILHELEDEGGVVRTRRAYREEGSLPPVTLLTVLEPDEAH